MNNKAGKGYGKLLCQNEQWKGGRGGYLVEGHTNADATPVIYLSCTNLYGTQRGVDETRLEGICYDYRRGGKHLSSVGCTGQKEGSAVEALSRWSPTNTWNAINRKITISEVFNSVKGESISTLRGLLVGHHHHLVGITVAHKIAQGVPRIIAVTGSFRHIRPKHVFNVRKQIKYIRGR